MERSKKATEASGCKYYEAAGNLMTHN
ncbi:uncharacterized protein G2W53_034448 [Senna tora]|uniref:Uncharacterized protein n=1 Tax=Senna tora TaxID=362788 RepID=A0A834W8W5_9FABA|nr:uncharacterized protein G2W53_034448 [Senna tora]